MAKTIKEELISSRKYNWLKQFSPDTLDQKDLDEIKAYEKSKNTRIKHSDYWDQVFKEQPKIQFSVTFDKLKEVFIQQYEADFGPFNQEYFHLVDPILKYFSKDKDFINCETLYQEGNIEPSFDKGLMLIGDFGTGKSSTMRTLHKVFQRTPLIFAPYSAKKIVEEYEVLSNKERKKYLDMLEQKVIYIDDLKTERTTNNYGVKFNILDHILFTRAENGVKTFVTCNYRSRTNGQEVTDLVSYSLVEFKQIYSPQVYDRIFSMFNILEFQGKSLRR